MRASLLPRLTRLEAARGRPDTPVRVRWYGDFDRQHPTQGMAHAEAVARTLNAAARRACPTAPLVLVWLEGTMPA